jgi:hypothetical protein
MLKSAQPYLERDLLLLPLPPDLLRLRSGEAGGEALRLFASFGDGSGDLLMLALRLPI